MIDFGFCDKLKHNKNGPAFTDFRTLATRIIHELQFFHSFSLTTPLAEGQSQVVRLAESDIDLINDGIFPKINI